MTDVCVICLDPAKDKNALFLLHCGCKAAWFHLDCENKWMDATIAPLKCPTCRRHPKMITNYGFHYTVGPEQKILWLTYLASFVHGFYFALLSALWYPEANFLIIQNGCFLLAPFLFTTSYTNTWYLLHSRVQMVYTAASSFLAYSLWNHKQINYLEFYMAHHITHVLAFFHFFVFSLVTVIDSCSPHKPKLDPFDPYVISREISHVKIQYALVTPESTTGSTEGNETTLSSSLPADGLRRSQRLQRNHR